MFVVSVRASSPFCSSLLHFERSLFAMFVFLGLWEQAYHQGYDPASIIKRVQSMLGLKAKL